MEEEYHHLCSIKISKWIINSFIIRNNGKKSSDKTDSNFSIISKDQRQLANFFKDQSQGQKIGKRKQNHNHQWSTKPPPKAALNFNKCAYVETTRDRHHTPHILHQRENTSSKRNRQVGINQTRKQ